MLASLALFVFCAAIFVVFSQEFIGLYKKIFAIKGVSLFLPLLLASWFVYTFDYWALWAVYYYREILQTVISFLVSIMPFRYTQEVALILILTVVSVVPVIILDILSYREMRTKYKYPYVTSTIIWMVTTVLLVII